MKRLFRFSMLTFFSTVVMQFCSVAQSMPGDTIQWIAREYADHSTDSISYAITSTFTFFADARIDWLQERVSRDVGNASKLMSLQIAGITGSWPDIQQPGEVAYTVHYGDRSGTVHIRKAQDQYTLSVHLEGTGGGLDFQFDVEPSTF